MSSSSTHDFQTYIIGSIDIIQKTVIYACVGGYSLVKTPFTYLEVAILIMWVQVFTQIKVQKSGLCHEYKVRKLIENGLHANGINVYV